MVHELREVRSSGARGMDLHDWRFSIDQEGIAWAIFDREGASANALGARPLEELAAIITEVEEGARARTVRGLVILSGKERNFIVGADVNEFDNLKVETEVTERL